MKNYIKLLSVALLFGGVSQINASDTLVEGLYKNGLRSTTLTGGNYYAALGIPGLPDGDALRSMQSRLRAYEESLETSARVAPVASGGALDISDLVTLLSTARGHIGAYPALAFDGGAKKLDAGVLAAHRKSYAEIMKLDAFKNLRAANIAVLSHIVSTLVIDADLETNFKLVAAGKVTNGTYSGDTDVLTEANLAKPFAALAALIEKRYNAAMGPKTFYDGTTAVSSLYADEPLPKAVVAKLADETELTAYLTALSS
jgi:hypothetical protein